MYESYYKHMTECNVCVCSFCPELEGLSVPC
jgi:hypothetical protein